MAVLNFSTKAGTLEDLSKVITTARVLPVYSLKVKEFRNDPDNAVEAVRRFFEEESLIVRSSSDNEDGVNTSNAGRFNSVLNVPKNDGKEISAAIETVISSYESCNGTSEVLIQPMLCDIALSGVVFTVDIDTLAPYYVVNYDESGRTDTITSGTNGSFKTYVHFKEAPFPCEHPYLARLFDTCRELEAFFNNPCLDIEFAFDVNGILYILQVRPVVVNGKEDLSSLNFKDALLKIYKKIDKLSSPHPNLLGRKTLFGVMPDWNPAEMIGLRPRQLSLSLYKELITDNIWAYQRDNYGYRNLRSHPLLVSSLGIPFIDVRVDFNSFIPKTLDKKIAEKLIDHYLRKLETMPALHDKVEFEVIFSCYYFNLPEKLKGLSACGFNEYELKRIEFSLLDLTNNIIDAQHGPYKKDLLKIEILREQYDAVCNSVLPLIDKIYWLTEDCKRYGTLPFAGIARAAFIAVQFLKSFVGSGIMTVEDYERFMNSLNTITRRLNNTLCKISTGEITKEEFLAEFGHLRPGTYNILSPRYDENFEGYFNSIKRDFCETVSYEFSDEQISKINTALIEHGLRTDAAGLMRFIKEAVEGREYAKFIFTKSLSRILCLINELGRKVGVSTEDLSYVDVKTILNLYSSLDHRDVKDTLHADIEKNKELYKYTKAIRLPSLIKNAKEIYGFFVENDEPTFITLNKIRTETAREDDIAGLPVENRVVFIQSADPGYDFLFTKNIAGLVTQFGGANSHMAIRCAELGIPAVIGAGEKNYQEWSKAKVLEVDCANKQVLVIS